MGRNIEAIRLPLEMAGRPEGPVTIRYISGGQQVFLEYTRFRPDGIAYRRPTLTSSIIIEPLQRKIRRRRVYRNITVADTDKGDTLPENTTFTTRKGSVKKRVIR